MTPTQYFTDILLGTHGVVFLNGCYVDQGNLSKAKYKALKRKRMPKDWNKVNRQIVNQIAKNDPKPSIILCGELVQEALSQLIDRAVPGKRIDARHPSTLGLDKPTEYQKWLRHWGPGALHSFL